jgi:phospholipid/cholesterol/gamma-HCH transport system permease protein
MAESLPGVIGLRLRQSWLRLLYAAGFFWDVSREILRFFRRRQVGYKVLVMQILFTGFEAMSIILVISLALGAIINIIQSFTASSLALLGSGFIYNLLIMIITVELGPLLTALIIIARSGTAIATEIGGMVVSQEIAAYLSFGINPISYLVVPRVLGVIFSMLLLTVYFNFFGLVGSYLIAAIISPLPFLEYMNNMLAALSIKALVISLAKSLVFGTIISMVACFEGFSVQRSRTEVPQAGIRAVSRCIVYCIFADVLLSAMYWVTK